MVYITHIRVYILSTTRDSAYSRLKRKDMCTKNELCPQIVSFTCTAVCSVFYGSLFPSQNIKSCIALLYIDKCNFIFHNCGYISCIFYCISQFGFSYMCVYTYCIHITCRKVGIIKMSLLFLKEVYVHLIKVQ